jgi:myo-inositol-1-phosphate synthase
MLELCEHVGATVDKTYQLNFGGNTDFLNMFDPVRAQSKRHSKMTSLSDLVPNSEVSAGPSGYVNFLQDEKVAYIRIEGRLLLGMEFSMETRLHVEDSPNSAGVVLDAVRAARVALDRAAGGPVPEVCSYLFKNPPVLVSDGEAERLFDEFVAVD